MSTSTKKKRQPHKRRNLIVLGMIEHCKARPMRDRRQRRIKEREDFNQEEE